MTLWRNHCISSSAILGKGLASGSSVVSSKRSPDLIRRSSDWRQSIRRVSSLLSRFLVDSGIVVRLIVGITRGCLACQKNWIVRVVLSSETEIGLRANAPSFQRICASADRVIMFLAVSRPHSPGPSGKIAASQVVIFSSGQKFLSMRQKTCRLPNVSSSLVKRQKG